MKSLISVLSLESEDDIEVSAQKKLAILLSPKQIVSLSLLTTPAGELDVPALYPSNRLFVPVETL